MIKVTWDVEEYVALVDIYKRCDHKGNEVVKHELQVLSVILNYRANKLNIAHDEKYRNLNGMMIMYQNVVYIATNGDRGMSNASAAMQAVYNMSINAPEAFVLILKEFNRKYRADHR